MELTRGEVSLTRALEVLVRELVHVVEVVSTAAVGGRGIRWVWHGVSW